MENTSKNDSSQSAAGSAPGPGRLFNILVDKLADIARDNLTTEGRAAHIARSMRVDMKRLLALKILPWEAGKPTLFLKNEIDLEEKQRITTNFYTLVKAIEKCSIHSHIASLRIMFQLAIEYPMFHDVFCSGRNRELIFFDKKTYDQLIHDRYDHERKTLRDQIYRLADITRLTLDDKKEINMLAFQLSTLPMLPFHIAPSGTPILHQLLKSASEKTEEALVSIAYVKTWLEKMFQSGDDSDSPVQVTRQLPTDQCVQLIYQVSDRLVSKAEDELTCLLVQVYESYTEDKIIEDSEVGPRESFKKHFSFIPQCDGVDHKKRTANCHVLARGLLQTLWDRHLTTQNLTFSIEMDEVSKDGKLRRCIESIREHIRE